jgi:hypothetical protein
MLSRPVLKTKLKAAGVHLTMSLIVFVYLTYQIYYNWYPQPYFAIDGGWQGMRLIAGVDLVLGPLITFLIFDLRKKRREILFDLATILVIQFAALAYGVHTTYTQRPVAAIVIADLMVTATMEQYGGKLGSVRDLQRYSKEKPPIIFADFPRTMEGIEESQRIKSEEGVQEHAQMEHYRTQPDLKIELARSQARLMGLLDILNGRPEFESWLQENGKQADEVYLEYLTARDGNAWLAFDRDANLLGYFYVDEES